MVDCELIGVTKRYGDVVALGVSFGVRRGEFVNTVRARLSQALT